MLVETRISERGRMKAMKVNRTYGSPWKLVMNRLIKVHGQAGNKWLMGGSLIALCSGLSFQRCLHSDQIQEAQCL